MIVLDTNVVFEIMNISANSIVANWMAAQTNEIYLTSIAVAEIMFGIASMLEGKRQQELSRKADVIFREQFENRILVLNSQPATPGTSPAAAWT